MFGDQTTLRVRINNYTIKHHIATPEGTTTAEMILSLGLASQLLSQQDNLIHTIHFGRPRDRPLVNGQNIYTFIIDTFDN